VSPVEFRGGRGKEPNHTTARKPGPLYSINYSLRGKHFFVPEVEKTYLPPLLSEKGYNRAFGCFLAYFYIIDTILDKSL
jgi:hypothetical protein